MQGTPPIEAIRAAIDAHRRGRLETFQRDEAAKIAEFAREADAAEASSEPVGSHRRAEAKRAQG
jgi:hypothetical protein